MQSLVMSASSFFMKHLKHCPQGKTSSSLILSTINKDIGEYKKSIRYKSTESLWSDDSHDQPLLKLELFWANKSPASAMLTFAAVFFLTLNKTLY